VVHFNARSTTHLVCKSAKLSSALAVGTAEVCLDCCTIFAARLRTNAASVVVSLVLVVFLNGSLGTGSLWQRPSWEVLLR
jgi:hypothetical protein